MKAASLVTALALIAISSSCSASFLRSPDEHHGRELGATGYDENVDGYSDTGYCYIDGGTPATAHTTLCALGEPECFKYDDGVGTPAIGSTKWKDHRGSAKCSKDNAMAVELGTAISKDTDGAQTWTDDTTKKELVLADVTDVVVGMAVTGAVSATDAPGGVFVTAVDTGNKKITLNVKTTSQIADATTLSFYPAENKIVKEAKFGGCYMKPGAGSPAHKVTPCLGPWDGGSYFYPGRTYSGTVYGPYTAAEVPIGYCKSSTGKTQTGTDIPSGGYCALHSAACDLSDVATCSHGFSMGYSPPPTLTSSQCNGANGGVCAVGDGTLSTSMQFTDDAQGDCTGSNTWVTFPNGANTAYTAAIPTVETFLEWDHADNPGCYLDDLIGEPVTVAAAGSGAASVKSSTAAALLVASATVAALSA